MLFLPSVLNSLSGCSVVLCSTTRKLTADVKTYLSVTSLILVDLKPPTQSTACCFFTNALCCQGRNAEGFSLDEIRLKNLQCAKGWAKTVQEHQAFWGTELTWVAGKMWLLGQYETSEPCAGRTNGVLTNQKSNSPQKSFALVLHDLAVLFSQFPPVLCSSSCWSQSLTCVIIHLLVVSPNQ